MDKTIPKLSKVQRDKLHDASPEVFRQWVLSLPAVKKDLYHPIYKLSQAVLDGIRELDRTATSEVGLPELKLLLATLSCNSDHIHDAMELTKLSDEWKNDFISMSAREIGKLDNGEYFSDRQTFEREMPPFNEGADDRSARAVLANCDAINKTDNPFEAIKNANFNLLKYADIFFDMGSFSLLLHALNPRTFPYWDSCFIMYDLGIELDHDWAEFDFTNIFPFDAFKGYLDDCFDIQCELQEILAKNGTIIFTIAANAMLYPEEKLFRFKRAQTFDSACRELEKSIVCANNYSSSLSAFHTGFIHLDRIIGGIAPGDFVLVTSTSGEAGKDFAANISLRMARAGIPVEYFTFDKNYQSAATRMINSMCNRLWQDTGIKEASYHQLQNAITRVGQLSYIPITFHQSEPSQTLELLKMTAHRLKSDIGHIRKGLIVIEDLNALEDMNDPSDSVVEKSQLVSLKEIAERYGIPILAIRSMESSETFDTASSHYSNEIRMQVEQVCVDLALSIRLEPIRDAEDETRTSFARITVFRAEDNAENEITLVYDSQNNHYFDYFEMHDQRLADPNLPKKLDLETEPIDINSFLQHAEKVKTLVLDSLGEVENARIRAVLYINGWFEDGIPQQLAESLEKGCRDLNIDRIMLA